VFVSVAPAEEVRYESCVCDSFGDAPPGDSALVRSSVIVSRPEAIVLDRPPG